MTGILVRDHISSTFKDLGHFLVRLALTMLWLTYNVWATKHQCHCHTFECMVGLSVTISLSVCLSVKLNKCGVNLLLFPYHPIHYKLRGYISVMVNCSCYVIFMAYTYRFLSKQLEAAKLSLILKGIILSSFWSCLQFTRPFKVLKAISISICVIPNDPNSWWGDLS